MKELSDYPKEFKPLINGTKKYAIKNNATLTQLRKHESGKWCKVYKDGFVGNKAVSLHYFQSQSGKIFDFKVKWEHISNP